MSKKAKNAKSVSPSQLPLYYPGITLLISAIGFCSYWKYKQIEFVSKDLLSIYPVSYWLHAFTLFIFLFGAFYLATNACVFSLIDVKNKNKLLFLDSLSYLAWCLPWLGLSAPFTLLAFIELKAVTNLIALKSEKAKLKEHSRLHLAVLFLLLIVHTQFNGTFSPKNWDNPMAALNKGESLVNTVSSSLHHVFYVNSKMHDLSGFESSSWGSLPHSPTSASSPVFGFLTWVLDYPSADPESFYRLVMIFFFSWFVAASFGFYLFVLYGLDFSFPVAVIGGLLYTLANHSLSLLASNYVPFFTGVFLCLPYALLFIRLSFRKEDYRLAFLSGSAFSLNFYLLQPHPDSLMHGVAFWGSYALFLAFITHSTVSIGVRIKILTAAFASFFIGSLLALAPVFESMLAKEVQVWGHLDGILVRFNFTQAFQGVLIPLLMTLGFLIVECAIGFKTLQQKLTKKSEFWFFLIWFALLFICILPGSDSPFIKLLTQLNFNRINFLGADRIFLYFSLSATILVLMGLEAALNQEVMREDTYKWLCVVALVVPFFLPFKDANYSYLLLGTAVVLAGAISYWLKKKNHFTFHYLFLMCATLFALVNEGSGEWISSKLQNNPQNCSYYFSLRGLNAKARFLPEDFEANSTMLKHRLYSFEKNLSNSPTAAEFRKIFQEHLRSVGATSSLTVSDNKFSEFAPKASVIADEMYLKESRCPYPRDFGGIYDPNTAVLFDKVPDRFMRIQGLTGVTMNGGIGEGFFLNDATSGVDPRFMWGYPTTAALYFFPGEYYKEIGHYEALMLGRQKASVLSNAKNRKLFNISGIDAYNVIRDDFKLVTDHEDYKVIEDDIPAVQLIKDTRSYGVAYLAKRIQYQKPRDLSFAGIRPPFLAADSARFESYKKTVDALTEELAAIPEKQSAIIETNSLSGESKLIEENQFTLLNILGNKAAFKVNCKAQPCRLVFNQSNVIGWNAFSDKTPLTIDRANFAFMSVAVPEGAHLVWFEHRPWGIILGALLTCLSYFAAAFFLVRRQS